MLGTFLCLKQGMTWQEGLGLALARREPEFYHDVVLIDEGGQYCGLISVRALVSLQSALLAEETRRLKEVLEELQQSQARVIQQERLTALGQMASGIAHDFNNTLMPILGYSELLRITPDAAGDREKVLRYAEIINRAAADAAKVVGRLREFYRARDPRAAFKPVQLADVVCQAASLTQPKWKNEALAHGAAITVVQEFGDVPPVAGNDSELCQALTNLILNAADAMPRGGTITIRTWSEEGTACVEIRDTGVGMTDDVRQRCMEPFFTTKGLRGTGLGLAMVFGTVKRHEGSVQIESTVGHGTSVFIRLPCQAPRRPDPPVTADDSPLPPLRVLVVDDEPIVRELVCTYLQGVVSKIEVAADGREGLDKFRNGRFDVVLTDRCMPRMNGDQLACEIKLQAPAMPIIMLTGFGDFMNAKAERPQGVDVVLNKPVKLLELRQAIVSVTARQSLLKPVTASEGHEEGN
jgi:signal transduction histidine kinase/ActR/RegA family two-component response regulator